LRLDEKAAAFDGDDELGIGVDQFDGLDRDELLEQLEKTAGRRPSRESRASCFGADAGEIAESSRVAT